MLPTLPAWRRPPPFGPAFPWLALALLLATATPARAMDLVVGAPREHAGYLYCDVEVADPFEERVRESLGRGMPATVTVHAELWRRRRGWFGRLESSYDAEVRIRYETWSERYRVDRPGADPIRVTTLDSVAVLLSRAWSLPVARIGQMQPRVTYYVAVGAVLKPLSVEDVQEVEGWLSGEVETKRHAGLGVVTELPLSLFDAVRNFAGFGDRRVRVVSPDFQLEDLFGGGR